MTTGAVGSTKQGTERVLCEGAASGFRSRVVGRGGRGVVVVVRHCDSGGWLGMAWKSVDVLGVVHLKWVRGSVDDPWLLSSALGLVLDTVLVDDADADASLSVFGVMLAGR